MLKLIVMKKYNLFLGTIALLSTVLLSACDENKGTRTMVYTEQPPYLTIMTQTTTTPADTYSEYMATYTEENTDPANFFAIPHMYGVGADTAMGSFPSAEETSAPVTDTAAALPQTAPPVSPETLPGITETVSAPEESSLPESTEASETTGTETSTYPGTVTITSQVELPAPDTASPHAVQADTLPTIYSESNSDSDSESSGTDGN